MPKGSGKPRGHDFAAIARRVVEQAIGEKLDGSPLDAKTPKRARGGVKGGKARAKKLDPKQRSEIARIAAEARWKKT
jgi:hypothetical protein